VYQEISASVVDVRHGIISNDQKRDVTSCWSRQTPFCLLGVLAFASSRE